MWVVPLNVETQTGAITGRVTTEDGGGLANVTVMLFPVNLNQKGYTRQFSTITDEEGVFKFTGVPSRTYTIQVFETKGYISQPIPASEMGLRGYYRTGDNAVITLIRGGVITGRVTNPSGEPMIDVRVGATMTRDAEGNPVRRQFVGLTRATDDQGIYRLYGLAPGTYVVGARLINSMQGLSPYDGDAPTYHPSSTRDTATEVVVTSGGEATGVDIRHRGEPGHVVSGTLTVQDASQPYSGVTIFLFSASTGALVGSGFFQPRETSKGFAIYGVSDGEYEIVAGRVGYNKEEAFASSPRRITVRGADVGGIELKLAPLASIAGKIVLEKSENVCEAKRKASIDEVVVSLRRDEKNPRSWLPHASTTGAPADKGEFMISSVNPGRYFIEPRLPVENWYVKSIAASAQSAPAGARRPATAAPDVVRSGVTLKAGEKLTGLTVAVADGAASLSGKVVAAKEGAPLPSRVRLHLVPVEATEAGNVLRYAEAIVRGDGAFTLNNIAPGKYWLMARAVPDDEPSDRPPTPVAWDANERAKLRKDAETSKVEVELKPCQRAAEQIVRFAR